VKITYRQVEPSDELASLIQEEAVRLHRISDEITSCKVVLEVAHRHGRSGKAYQARVAVTVPGRLLVVRRRPLAAARHADPRVAVVDAFHALHEVLAEHRRRRYSLQPQLA